MCALYCVLCAHPFTISHPKVESKCKSLERAIKPYAALLSRPESALTVYDNCPRGNKISSVYDGDQPLSTEELLWLGTASTVGGPPHSACNPASLPTAPQWLLMPVYDVSLKVGFKGADLVGTLPGQLCTEWCVLCNVCISFLLDASSYNLSLFIANYQATEWSSQSTEPPRTPALKPKETFKCPIASCLATLQRLLQEVSLISGGFYVLYTE